MNGHLVSWNLKNWKISTLPDDYDNAVKALNEAKLTTNGKDVIPGKAGYYRGYFNLKRTGDTFLNFEAFGKGQVYVNGHPMGRIWSIGPQQTLYVPGCWLKKGRNEIIVLDVVGPKSNPICFGQDHPELDKLNIEKSAEDTQLDMNKFSLVGEGAFAAGNGWQTQKLKKASKGRYLALICMDAQDGKDVVSIAEIYLQGADGKRLSREPWTVKYVSSEDFENGNQTGDKVYDLQESTYWNSAKGVKFPHILVLDLGGEQTITAIEYLPRAEQGAPGSVKNYKLYMQ